MLQLNPPLPMDTVRGPGLAHFVIDYGPESHLMWVVFLDADGACWTIPNPEVRLQANWSLQRRPARKPFAPPERPEPIVVPPLMAMEPPAAPGANGHANGAAHYDAAAAG